VGKKGGVMDRKDIPISACLVVQDEEAYIETAVKNLLPNVREVVVVDGGSKDKTVEVCKKLGCRVEERKFDFDFSAQRNFAMSVCETDWVLFCDADEWFSEEFYTILPSLLLNPLENCFGYHVYRISRFDGQVVGTDFQWRVLHKTGGFWQGKVHEGFTFYSGKMGLKMPKEYCMYHEHTMKRQLYNNALYYNINQGIKERPADNKGMEYQTDKWIEVPTRRDG
jgi:glycosyltransferase involved in cell wall biosynthesis